MIAVPHPKWDERPLLVVVPHPAGAPPSPEDVLAFMQVRSQAQCSLAAVETFLCTTSGRCSACGAFAGVSGVWWWHTCMSPALSVSIFSPCEGMCCCK